ncbi:myomodulin neuropeptides [Lingula anatina]|uniref:Myomodulin neuropeptides n=1 Tax=Lingula anatina TaxID=7574 RepID=A0A1S3JLU5_LINAN|nr:myomodulin neuropeptides [Lingula anatina]|eukprot:XP_013410884.1 myomodulin neuropeptides [Lingula anatina]
MHVLATATICLLFQAFHGYLADGFERDTRGLGIMRMGKRANQLKMIRLGRGMRMLRLGKRGDPYMYGYPYDLFYEPRNDIAEQFRRQIPTYPRIGKDLDYAPFSEEWNWPAANPRPRVGKELQDYEWAAAEEANHDASLPFVLSRKKRSAVDRPESHYDEKKGSPSLPRLGEPTAKRSDDEPLPYLPNEDYEQYVRGIIPYPRIGRYEAYDMPPVYDEDPYFDTYADKRAFRGLRLGKRMRMLRLGRSDSQKTNDLSKEDSDFSQHEEKRKMRMLRLGKRSENSKISKVAPAKNEIASKN